MLFFAYPIFRLTHLTFRPQKRDTQVAPRGQQGLLDSLFLLNSKYNLALNSNYFEKIERES